MPPRKHRLTSNAGSRGPRSASRSAIALQPRSFSWPLPVRKRAGRTARKARPIQFEYVAPKDPAHQTIHDQMKEGRALEHLQQLLSPLRLPYPLTLKVDRLRRRHERLVRR